MIGRRIEVVADLARVRSSATAGWSPTTTGSGARHQTISDPEHVAAVRALRMERLEIVRPAVEPQVVQRCLTDYDIALGLGVDVDGGVA